jgi:hypothetical protein
MSFASDRRQPAPKSVIGNPERVDLSGALDPEDMTIHRQDYTAI